VKWHDGKDFTAQDVVYNAAALEAGFCRHCAEILADAKAVDNHTVLLTFSTPVPEFFLKSTLAGAYQLVLPRHLYEGKDIITNPANNTPVGTGPWKVRAMGARQPRAVPAQ
jgi:peptide/nickel transport system substrate-binding protein